jgi:glycosyltransferase involved in cell wall biosynthesis
MDFLPTLANLYAGHKGKLSDRWSLYIDVLDEAFSSYREKPINLLEIGIQNGGSLEIWAQYFSRAEKIIGCDFDENCGGLVFDDPRISVVIGDANTSSVEMAIRQQTPSFDLIIDDGSHQSADMISSFLRYFPMLNEGGIYLVEDMHCSYWKDYGGSLHNPLSAMNFFKRLADILNYEHWRNNRSRAGYLENFATSFNVQINEPDLTRVHSIEFLNSLCMIRKAEPDRNLLGNRVVTGRVESITTGAKSLNRTSILDNLVEVVDDRELDVFALIQTKQASGELRTRMEEQSHNTRVLETQLADLEKQNRNIQAQLLESDKGKADLQNRIDEQERLLLNTSALEAQTRQELMELRSYTGQREQILQNLNTTLLDIYSSTAWKIVRWMWRVRLWLAPIGSRREKLGRAALGARRRMGGYRGSPNQVQDFAAAAGQGKPGANGSVYTGDQAEVSVDKGVKESTESQNTYENVRHPWRKQALENFLALVHNQYPGVGSISHMVMLPLFSSGGGELVAVNYIRSIVQARPETGILLLVTDRSLIDHHFEIPENVIVLNVEALIKTNDWWKKKLFVYDLIRLIKPAVIHNINSSITWEVIIDKGKEIREFSGIFANIFCFQFNEDGSKTGYAEYYLRAAIPYLDGLLSDNQRFIDGAVSEYQLSNDAHKFHTIYTPSRQISEEDAALVKDRLERYPTRVKGEKRLRCLWAGRLDAQKRWDLFLDIVKACDFCDFDMYGKSVIDETPNIPDYPNLHFCGDFKASREAFLREEYDAFVFTSQWEGLPTILLDSGLYGTPIIAPTVGGVGELVNQDTGYPLVEQPSVQDYQNALQMIREDPDEAARRAGNLIDLIHDRHSWPAFYRETTQLKSYLE